MQWTATMALFVARPYQVVRCLYQSCAFRASQGVWELHADAVCSILRQNDLGRLVTNRRIQPSTDLKLVDGCDERWQQQLRLQSRKWKQLAQQKP